MKYDVLIKGGKVVVPKTGTLDADIAILGEKISAIAERPNSMEAREVIDATGKHVLPGVIDPHVHWGHSGDFAAEAFGESKSAAFGGCTTVINVFIRPPEDEEHIDQLFAQARTEAERFSHIDIAFHMTIFNDKMIGEVDHAVRDWGISSFKFFMAYKKRPSFKNRFTDGLFYDSLAAIAKYDRGVACVHCENDEVIDRFTERAQAAKMQGLAAWLACRPDFAEAENVLRALYFGELTGCPVYIVHLSARASLEQFTKYKLEGSRVYAETCLHYLLHNVDSPVGILGKVQPPIRTQESCDALWEGIADGRIDTMGSDSCATRLATKRGKGDIWTATSSFPGTGLILPLLISEGYHKRGLTLERIVELTSYNAANIFNLYPRKGALRVGSDADLAIVDLNLEKIVTGDLMQGHCDYTLFDGWKVKGWPVATLVRGKVMVKDGQVIGQSGHGRYIERNAFLK